jgi:formate-nitrite transporter family protein
LALAYSVGYILVVIGRSELFTEHTTRSVYPVLHGDAKPLALARLYVLIYASNLLGCALFAKAIVLIAPAMNIVQPWAFGHLASIPTSSAGWVVFVSAILAGWLMGVLSWLVAAGRDSMGQITVVAIITATIGICHLQHCIVGSTEVLIGYFAHQGVSFAQFLHFLTWATLGNATGGFVFVALIKYGHAINSGKEPEHVELEEGSAS